MVLSCRGIKNEDKLIWISRNVNITQYGDIQAHRITNKETASVKIGTVLVRFQQFTKCLFIIFIILSANVLKISPYTTVALLQTTWRLRQSQSCHISCLQNHLSIG